MPNKEILYIGLVVVLAVCTAVFVVRLVQKVKECGVKGYALRLEWARLVTDFILAVVFGTCAFTVYNLYIR